MDIPLKSIVPDAEIYIIDNFISNDEADELFALLNDESKFKYYNLNFYDVKTKSIVSARNHRKSYWLGEHAQAVQKSNNTAEDDGKVISIPTEYVLPYTFPELVMRFKNRIEKKFDIEFNSCLVGKFESPTDKIGFHSDSSDSMGPNPIVGSLSLGRSRNFIIQRSKKYQIDELKKNKKKINLQHGTLCMMGNESNVKYLHMVPPDSGCCEDDCRINLTFRNYKYFPDEMEFSASPF
uniref:Fe2OG dioxygenase domain-containing protein n=1 Tax=viral metagenome TaxID=1070528 RepID=A0A6C0CA24_9ZZZZ